MARNVARLARAFALGRDDLPCFAQVALAARRRTARRELSRPELRDPTKYSTPTPFNV